MLVRLIHEHYGLHAGTVCEVRELFGVYTVSKVVFGDDPWFAGSVNHYLFVLGRSNFEVLDDGKVQGR